MKAVTIQGKLFQEDVDNDILNRLCTALPKLPPIIRYYDEFDDVVRTINAPISQQSFEIAICGAYRNLDFSKLDTRCAFIFKHVFVFLLAQDISIGSVDNYLRAGCHLSTEDVEAIVDAGPTHIGKIWNALRARALPTGTYVAAKCLLQLLCAYRLNGWSTDYLTYLSTTLPLPATDKYAGVRSGDVFLSADEEAAIVRHLDQTVERLAQNDAMSLSQRELADAGILLCAYQFAMRPVQIAMRPVQIAMLDTRHVRIWNDDASASTVVHLTFHMAKQRDGKRVAMTRRVKTEWTPIFIRWKAHLDTEEVAGAKRFFRVKDALN